MDNSTRLDAVLSRWYDLRASGEDVAPEDLCRDCPELLDVVRWIAAVESRRGPGGPAVSPSALAAIAPASALPAALDPGAPTASRTVTRTPVHLAEAAARSADLRVPGYEILGELGEGGMGLVLLARDTRLQRQVAVKTLKPEYADHRELRVRFLDEAHITAQLQHPGVPPLHELGTLADGRPFFAMKIVKGDTLSDLLCARPSPAENRERFLKYFEQVCEALAYAHDRGVIHRDLKPGNVMVGAFGELQVMDWGLAKILTADAAADTVAELPPETRTKFATPQRDADDRTRGAVGTYAYMPPEQAKGRAHLVDERCDVFSLGAMLCEILTGQPPYTHDAGSISEQAEDGKLEPAFRRLDEQAADPDLVALAKRCLAADRDARPRQAQAVYDAIKSHRENQEEQKRQAERDAAAARATAAAEGKRRKVVWAAAASLVAVLLLGIVGTTVGLWRADRARQAESRREEERDAARDRADEQERDQKYQLGISNFLLANVAYENRDVRMARERLELVPPDQRKFEWHYLARQTKGGLFTLYGHTGSVSGVAYSPDGTRFATAGDDGTAKIWDARTGILLHTLIGHDGGVRGVAYSPDGTRLATASDDGTAKVWDARTAAPLLTLSGHAGPVSAVAYSPDGTRVATAGDDRTAKAWDARTGAPLLTLSGHAGPVRGVAYSPDGCRLATASRDNTAKVWDAMTGAPLLTLSGHASWMIGVAYSPDGTRLATASDDGTAKVWDARSGVPLDTLSGHTGPVSAVVYSPDGTRLATASDDGTAKVWDARTAALLLTRSGHAGPVRGVAYSPDGSRVATAGDDHTAKVWDARSGASQPTFTRPTAPVRREVYSPDGTRFAADSLDNTARVWDARTRAPLLTLTGHAGPVRGVAYSPDGARVATASDDRTAKVWDARTGAPLLTLFGHTGGVHGVTYNPDGTRLATAGDDRTAKVWDARTGAPLLTLSGHSGRVAGVAYSPDGTRLAVASLDNTATEWDARSGQELEGEPAPPTILPDTYTPDRKFFAHRDGNRTRLIPTTLTRDELEYRLFGTRPDVRQHREHYERTVRDKDGHAAAFHLDRLLAYVPDERPALLAQRARMPANHLVEARRQRLAYRLQAQVFLARGQPGPALPLLHVSLLSRTHNQPPVEEFLIAEALLALNRPDDAKRYHRAAVEWRDRLPRPGRMAAGLAGSWVPLQRSPADDPRYNPFDWESWHESDLFRRRVEAKLRP